jgi:hypothetical protein
MSCPQPRSPPTAENRMVGVLEQITPAQSQFKFVSVGARPATMTPVASMCQVCIPSASATTFVVVLEGLV